MSIRRLLPIVAVVAVASGARDVHACSCIGGQPPCAQFWDSAAVFSGRVISIEPVMPSQPFSPRRVRFAVGEAFRGVSTPQIQLTTGGGGGDCGYPFVVGESYFVYGYSGPAGLGTGICSRTRKLADAAEDIAYARAVPLNAPLGAIITGRVFDETRNVAEPPAVQRPPLAGARVLFDCDGAAFSGVTGRDGSFSITGVPVGTCRSRIEGAVRGGISQIVIPDPRGCAAVDLVVTPAPPR